MVSDGDRNSFDSSEILWERLVQAEIKNMQMSKNLGPEHQALVILQRGFALLEFIELLKLQISDHKYQTMT